MSSYTTPRKSLRFRKNVPSPFLFDRKRELFPVDNWDDDSHDIRPLQSSPEVHNPGLTSPGTPYKMNSTPVTELSPTMSDKFERLMSETKNGNVCSATIVIEETPSFRRVKHFNTTPFESETNKEAKTPSKKSFNLNTMKNNKTELAVKTSSFYGGNQVRISASLNIQKWSLKYLLHKPFSDIQNKNVFYTKILLFTLFKCYCVIAYWAIKNVY